MSTHIASELLELYALGRVAEPRMADIEEHLLVCDVCRERLRRTEDFIAAIRWGLSSIDKILALHQTKDGPVFVFTRQVETGWLARVLGRELDFGLEFPSAPFAEDRARAAFAEMFPEHTCTDKCQIY